MTSVTERPLAPLAGEETQLLPSETQDDRLKRGLAITGKVLLVAIVVAGFAAATFFSGGLTLAFLAGGASWCVTGALAVTSLVCGVTTLGAIPLAVRHNMFWYTDSNLKDCGHFVAETSIFATRIVGKALLGIFCQVETNVDDD